MKVSVQPHEDSWPKMEGGSTERMEKNSVMGVSMICTPYRILFGEKSNEDDMVGTCSMHWVDENAYRILVGKPERKRQPGTLDVDGRIILKWIVKE
jgi:hypothetical protein